jgi:hypothetical protein
MDFDLRILTEEQRQTILHFAESLVNRQTVNGEIDFDSPDVEEAEISATEFAQRRNAGYRNTEIAADSEIRTGIREWLKRTNRKSL